MDLLSIVIGVFGVASGMLNIVQYLRDRATRSNIEAVKGSMQSLTDMCKDISDSTFSNPEAMKQFVKSVSYQGLGVKRQLDTLLPARQKRPEAGTNLTISR